MGIRKDKTTKTWAYQFQHKGRGYGGRGFQTRRDAEAARAKRRDEIKALIATQTKTATAFIKIANDYLDVAQRKFVKDVYKRKKKVLKDFKETLQFNIPIDQITSLHVHNFLKTLPSNSLYNEYRHELSAMFNWVKKTYAAQFPFLVNPCIGIESMTHVTAEKKIPTEKEILRMVAAASPGDNRDIVLTCLQTLGRIDEVLRLRWHEDVNFDQRYVVLWTRKRKNGAYEPDALPMNQDLYDILYHRWKHRKQDQWVFYNEATGTRYMNRPRMMWSICHRAGVTPIGTTKRKVWRGKDKGKIIDVPVYYGFHALRHFMASYLLDEQKASLKTVSKMLRHKRLQTTEIYSHQIGEGQRIATDKIEGKFTLKNANPIQSADTEGENETKRGLDISSNP